MSSSRALSKRKYSEVSSLDEREEKFQPTNVEQPQNTTRTVMQRLATQEELDAVSVYAAEPNFIASNAFTFLKEFNVPLLLSIVHLISSSPESTLFICLALIDLHEQKIELTDEIVKSMANEKRTLIASNLIEFHAQGIKLIDKIVQGMTLAVNFVLHEEYFIAIQLLYINNLINDESIHKLDRYLYAFQRAAARHEEEDSNDETYLSEEEFRDDAEDPIGIVQNIMHNVEKDNAMLVQKFDDFLKNPEESHALPLPTPIKLLVRSFFSEKLRHAETELRENYRTRIKMLI